MLGKQNKDKDMKNQLGVIMLVLIASFFSACTSDPSSTMIERNKELIITMNRELWNIGNLSVINDLFSPDFVQHFLPDGTDLNGTDALREQVKTHREAFPNWEEHIKFIVAENNLVVIQFESSGTNSGSWLGNPASGNEVHINEFSIFKIQNGKIIEQWLMPDIFNLRKQIGLDDR